MSKKETNYKCPYTYDDLSRLELAIGEGVKEVQYADKRITYRSLSDMMKAAQYMKLKLGLIDTPTANKGLFGGKRIVMRATKGLCTSDNNNEHAEDERFDRNDDN